MTDIMQERITLIEDLTKKRQPITNMEAIYFITPSEDSIARVLSDFADPARPQYKGKTSTYFYGFKIFEPKTPPSIFEFNFDQSDQRIRFHPKILKKYDA